MNGLESPYEMIVDALLSGSAVPFFGSAASAIVRPPSGRGLPGRGIGARENRNRCGNENAGGRKSGDIGAAIKPVLSNHFGGPPGLALVASYYSQVQGTRKILEGKLHQAFDPNQGRTQETEITAP